ncbi:hypothetical protein [Flavobacterium sp. N2270]|uniref:hypothetical protein n=1 Tax=Flavobacterium sp. N2270 TaxID=2986831 RepID=UPI0022249FE2|nr:hypothetical protein [Flavobacterium sp. N2270]
MKKKLLLTTLFLSFSLFAQVGVGTTTPRGALDINSSTSGMIPPRVALTATNVAAPVVNPQGGALIAGTLVWNTNTAGTIPTNVAPGMYYWDGTRWISLAGSPGGLDWSIIGNGGIDGGVTGVTGTPATTGTHFVGTYDTTNFDVRTSGLPAARFSSLGEFFIGDIETVLPGDLMNAVSEGNALFPWAVNGYTDQNGSGIYGLITGGNTNFGAVQGEYDGTSNIGAGVRGMISNTTPGTGFNTPIAGVKGDGAITGGTTGAYKFGVAGRGGATRRSGAIFGDDFGFGRASLGYFDSVGNDYGVYAFGTTRANGVAGGRSSNSNSSLDTSIGIGVYGGVVGGWIKGHEYGMITKGDRYANYSHGKNITNESFIVLDKKIDGSKSISYASTSMNLDIQDKGVGSLSNGTSYVSFDKNYSEIIDSSKPIIVTITPLGENNGVHIVSVDKNGFTIKENNSGKSNVKFNWIVIAEKKSKFEPVSLEILDKNYDKNLEKLMHNDELDGGYGIWSENEQINFGADVPSNPLKLQRMNEIIEVKRKGERTPKKENLRASQIKELTKK